MQASGAYTLGDIAVGAVGTYEGAWTDSLAGVRGITCEINRSMTTGTDGVVTAYLQTSFGSDDGVDVAAFSLFGNPVLFGVSGLEPTALVQGTDATMAPGTILNFMGDRFRLKLTVAAPGVAGPCNVFGRLVAR
jgi:hypothetical protein